MPGCTIDDPIRDLWKTKHITSIGFHHYAAQQTFPKNAQNMGDILLILQMTGPVLL